MVTSRSMAIQLEEAHCKMRLRQFLFRIALNGSSLVMLAACAVAVESKAQQPAKCTKSADGTTFCYEKVLKTYSIYRKDGGYIYGKCGGTVRWGGSFEFTGASQFHANFCDGEEITPQ